MALCFALGSTCFFLGPFPGYVQLVGESADGVTFFVGSVLFTGGGLLQSRSAWLDRRSPEGGRAAWWSAVIQSAGTLFFNVTTYQAMHTALTDAKYNALVWRPDWRGSVCFLVSGAIAYRASRRRGWLPLRRRARLVAAGRQPARLHLLRDLRRRRLRGSRDGVDARSGGGQLEHRARRRLLSGLRARHPAHRRCREDAGPPSPAHARGAISEARPHA